MCVRRNQGIRTLIGDGYMRSATFKTLVDTVENLSCVVYVTSAVKLSDGMRGALLHSAAGSRELPVLRVLLKASLAPYEAIAVIGHELQHVIEAVRGLRPIGAPRPGCHLRPPGTPRPFSRRP